VATGCADEEDGKSAGNSRQRQTGETGGDDGDTGSLQMEHCLPSAIELVSWRLTEMGCLSRDPCLASWRLGVLTLTPLASWRLGVLTLTPLASWRLGVLVFLLYCHPLLLKSQPAARSQIAASTTAAMRCSQWYDATESLSAAWRMRGPWYSTARYDR
jgi:hypothetical protein